MNLSLVEEVRSPHTAAIETAFVGIPRVGAARFVPATSSGDGIVSKFTNSILVASVTKDAAANEWRT